MSAERGNTDTVPAAELIVMNFFSLLAFTCSRNTSAMCSGPVTFVERQIGHAWAAGVVASIGIFFIEVLLHLDVLILSPVLAVAAGMIFLVKAGTLSGWFYIASAASFLTAIPMALVGPPLSPLMFGFVSAIFFFIPGLKYYRQRLRQRM